MACSDEFQKVRSEMARRDCLKDCVKGLIICLVGGLMLAAGIGAYAFVARQVENAEPIAYTATWSTSIVRIHKDLELLLSATRNASLTQSGQLQEFIKVMHAVVHGQERMIHLLGKLKPH